MRKPFGNLWLDTFMARKSTTKYPNQDLSGKSVVFTGGTDGMGLVAVERFVEMGAEVCLLARNPEKTANALKAINNKNYSGVVFSVNCDLSSLSQVKRAAGKVLNRFKSIDFLINCAGVNATERTLSEDGFEMNFAVNYLGSVLLTELLLERIKSADKGKILHITSATQAVGKLDFEDLQFEKNWSLLASYAQAKVCLIMHGRDVARRLEKSRAFIKCLNPGYIKSNLTRNSRGPERIFTTLFGHLASPTWVGGERIVSAALSSEYEESKDIFIYEDIHIAPNPVALDNSKLDKLMSVTHDMIGNYLSDEVHSNGVN